MYRSYKLDRMGEIEDPGFFRAKSMTSIANANLSTRAKLVAYILLSYWSAKRPRPFPCVGTIARQAGMSDASVRKALRELEQALAIRTTRTKARGSNTYSISGLLHLPEITGEEWAEKKKSLQQIQKKRNKKRDERASELRKLDIN